MEILEVAPLMVAQNKEFTQFAGFIKVHNEYLQLSVELREAGSISGASLHGDAMLQHFLRGSEGIMEQLLSHCPSPAAFFRELTRLLERKVKEEKSSEADITVGCQSLLEEIEDLGWHNLVYIDSTFTKLTLAAVDSAGQSHTLRVRLPTDYPTREPVCETELPDLFQFSWNPTVSNLKSIHSQFATEVEKYVNMWGQLEEIDRYTWVLEPENPSPAAAYRRVALGNNTSVLITVNPLHPRSFPEISFLGPESIVTPLKQKLNEHMQDWDDTNGLVANLESILGIKFPSKVEMKDEEMHSDCGICYMYRLDGAIPQQTCDNLKCGQVYHQKCLYEWLRALPNGRQSFNTLFGECPYCNNPTSVKVPAK